MSKESSTGDLRVAIATRLRSERESIGRSQADFARALGVTRQSVVNYENGVSAIGADTLASASQLGVDVLFILTGQRSPMVPIAQNIATGNNNVVASHVANVSYHNTKVKQINAAKPGIEHISQSEKASLKALVEKIVELEKSLKRAPKGYGAIWSAVNRYCKVTKYDFIAVADFERAEKYLRQWIGRLNSMASAPVRNPRWRNGRYAYIKINTARDSAWLTTELQSRFGVSSLTELTDDGLDRVYRIVANLKRR